MPYPFRDSKPGLFPAEFYIPRANGQEFQVLIVKDGTRGVYLDYERGSERMVVPAPQIARSLVEDYVVSQPLQDQDAGPGFFWAGGIFDKTGVTTKLGKELKAAWESQLRWFNRLVRAADDLWIANHHYAQLGDLDRTACRELGLKRDWLSDDPAFIYKCPVCTTLISRDAIVCFACHVILKPEEMTKFQFLGGPGSIVGIPTPVQSVNTK
jgi:hypothetical protein